MKIVVFLNHFPVLAETFVLNQITALLDRGHDVAIFCQTPYSDLLCHLDVQRYHLTERAIYYGIPDAKPPFKKIKRLSKAFHILFSHRITHWHSFLKSLNFIKFRRRALSFRLFFLVHQFLLNGLDKYDIAHCHYFPNGDLAVALKQIGAFNGKIITTLHGEATYTGDKAFRLKKALTHKNLSTLFKEGDLFLPMSRNEAQGLVHIGCDPEKIIVHRMGVDTSKFHPMPFSNSQPDHVNLISVGRLVEKKGFEYTIKAVAKLLNTYSKISYTIIGGGPLRDTLQSLIDRLQIGSRVKILGPKNQDEVLEHLHKAHIFLAPSINSRDGDKEGIPVAIMEAMAFGLPILTTDHAGIPELVKDGICGFVVNQGDVDALSRRLIQLVCSPELRSSMGNASKNIVNTNFDVDRLTDRLVQLFDQVISDTKFN